MIHVTCFDRFSVLIVEHEVRETISHKELLHAVNLRQMKKNKNLLNNQTHQFSKLSIEMVNLTLIQNRKQTTR